MAGGSVPSMSQNPYEQDDQSWSEESGLEHTGEQRLSLLALFSLIFALICLIPGLGVLGVVFGASALIMISKSRGRLTGKGMAITGVVLGLIVSVLWGSAVVGFGQAFKYYRDRMIPPVAALVETAGSDTSLARTALTPGAAKSVTEEDFAQFAASLEAHYGKFEGAPKDLMSLATAFRDSLASQQQDQKIQGGSRGVPVPLRFERGAVLVIAVYDESSFDDQAPRFEDAFAVIPGRKAVTLRKVGRAKEEALNMGFEPVYGASALPETTSDAPSSASESGG